MGFSSTFSFIFVPYPWAMNAQWMLGANDARSENTENNSTLHGGSCLDNSKCSTRLHSLKGENAGDVEFFLGLGWIAT